jgi:hypothetical protein
MDWTTPDDLRAQVERYWTSGRLLGAQLTGEPLFPLILPFRKPGGKALAERFDEVRTWIKQLDEASKPRAGFGYEIQWTTINHRQLGRNRLPSRLVMPTEQDALKFIDKAAQADVFRSLAEVSLQRFPQLRGWLTSRPLAALDNAEHWPRLLCVLSWFQDHPRSGRYMRQIDLPGIDTKFVEGRTGLLADLLMALGAGDSSSGREVGFEQRFGLVSKPPLIRFRLLDERLYINGLSDLAVPAPDFARLSLPAERVFITENEINGLTFPQVPHSLVIFGLGYGLERLSEAVWLRNRRLHYWGDIDTHGFAMLDRLRADLPHAESFLMDRHILLLHRDFWVAEQEQFVRSLKRLTASEASLYSDLVNHRLGQQVRLEQERISFGIVEDAVRHIEHS